MTARTPFHVAAYPGERLGKFHTEADAVRIAQVWSKVHKSWAEVRFVNKNGGGLIAQFDKGELTAEFADRHEWLKPWLDHCKERLA